MSFNYCTLCALCKPAPISLCCVPLGQQPINAISVCDISDIMTLQVMKVNINTTIKECLCKKCKIRLRWQPIRPQGDKPHD